ncbi:putative sphingolipid transporter spinster-3-like protein [Morus notabilis]|uniref:Putative sphingolipid transporter spinster-3-like protein n=1 Tax=Morus notabilis TaxID=981085 RepID=W9RQB5_9ROSA|nr:putative sphingolipid transporter spinster-3-like protein [Morus notabilis]
MTSSTKPSTSNPSWFTPKRLLMIFCMINMLNYVDRGAIASNGVNGSLGTCSETGICTSGSGLQGDFNLNNFQDGVLSSAFMVGLLVASPIFAALAKSHNPFRLIGVGLSVWTFATAGCGCSFDFFSITFCRMLVGVGEASFISLAAPYIDDNAPAAQKTAWLAMFYMCIPTGVALGYVYGGISIDLGMAKKRTDGRLDAMDSKLEDIRAESQRLSNFEKNVEKLPDLERNMELLAQSVAQLDRVSLQGDPGLGKAYDWITQDMDKKTLVSFNCTFSTSTLRTRVGSNFNWRYAFWGEAFLMLPFAVLGFVVKPLQLKGFACTDSNKILTSTEETSSLIEEPSSIDDRVFITSDEATKLGMGRAWPPEWSVYPSADQGGLLTKWSYTSGLDCLHGPSGGESAIFPRLSATSKLANQSSGYLKDLKVLFLDKVYLVNILGYISYNFVIGAYSYWGPKAGYNIYHMSNADLLFGGVTIICGVLGTLAGGLILDNMNATISNAFKLLAGATFLGAIFCFSAFLFRSLYVFIALFTVGELLVFATQAPVNYVSLHCVRPSLRPLSMAISTVSIHIFGDVPSSPLVGILQDRVNNWRVTSLTLTSVLFVAAGIWFIGIFLNSLDMSNEDNENEVCAINRANIKPLLEQSIDGSPGESINEAADATAEA